MVDTCPHCGCLQPPYGISIKSLGQQRIFEYLHKHQKFISSSRPIADFVYKDDPKGGPDNASNAIRKAVGRLRNRLRPHGLTIESIKGCAGGYQLKVIE